MIFRGFAPRRFWICRSSSGGGCRRPADGCFGYSAQRAEGFCSRPFGVLYRCRLRRRRLPGPAPAGGPISCTDKKWGKEAAGGHAPLTSAPPPVGLRPKSAAPLSRMSGQAYSIPPAAAPRAQCLCRRVSGTVPEVLPGRHVRFCMARISHREAENCAATPRTRSERANARYGRCFPLGGSPRAIRLRSLGAPAT